MTTKKTSSRSRAREAIWKRIQDRRKCAQLPAIEEEAEVRSKNQSSSRRPISHLQAVAAGCFAQEFNNFGGGEEALRHHFAFSTVC